MFILVAVCPLSAWILHVRGFFLYYSSECVAIRKMEGDNTLESYIDLYRGNIIYYRFIVWIVYPGKTLSIGVLYHVLSLLGLFPLFLSPSPLGITHVLPNVHVTDMISYKPASP